MEKNIHDIKLLKNLNLLYVEDDPIVASQTRGVLKNFFRHIFYCENAEDALKLLKNERVHMMITDIELPGMNGLQLCEKIRQENSRLPIFITSIHNHKEMLREAIKLNLVDYLIKPVSIASITQALKESLQKLESNGVFMVQLGENLHYCPLLGEVDVSGKRVLLTHTESILLDLLIRHQNQIVHYDSIEYALNPEEPMSESAFKNLLYRLRKKVGKEKIVAVSGVGIILKTVD